MTDRLTRQLANVKRWPRKSGKRDYMRHLEGEHLTRAEAIRACCYECVCGDPGRPDGNDKELCKAYTCPLQPFCQWNKETDDTEGDP